VKPESDQTVYQAGAALGQRPSSSVPEMILHSRGDLEIIEEQNEPENHSELD
jgi:hypothetical protein